MDVDSVLDGFFNVVVDTIFSHPCYSLFGVHVDAAVVANDVLS